MPTFYDDPVILDARTHGGLMLAANRKFAFARNVNCVPVLLGEMTKLLPFYPVIFTTGKEPILVAVLGVRNDENLFVDEKGDWAPGMYIPAYVRRYPFILTRIADTKSVLSAQLDKTQFGDSGEALFENRRPTKLSRDAFRFCTEFQQGFEETREFCKGIQDSGLLHEKTCTIRMKVGLPLKLTGFTAVDENEIEGLDNRTANGWRKKHWLKYLYYHIASLEHLVTIAARIENRLAA